MTYFATAPGSPAFFAAGAFCFLLEFSVPPFAESARATPFHRHHIIERYGLLMIISLGEIVLSVSHGFATLFGDHPSAAAALVSVAALVIVFSVWWLYFCEAEHLVTTRQPTALIWGYGHVFIFMATAALGATIAASVDVATHHAKAEQADVSTWLGASLALYCLTLWIVRDRVLALSARTTSALPAMAAAFALAGIAGLPVWVFAALSVLAVIWRAPDIARRHT